MNGIMALKRGGKRNKKTAKEKKVATARYKKVKKAGEAARAEYNRDRARSNQGNKENKKETTTVLSPLEALIANKDELVKQDAGDGVRNQYQVQMDNYKKGLGAYAGMDPKKNKAVFKERFPNPLVKIAQGIGNYIKQGGALGILANALGGGKKAATGFGKDASTMAKDLAGMFGLDSLKSKLINIAGGKDTNDFNKIIQNNQTSTAMRNNLAYGDPLGLNKKFPVYNDPIMNMGYVPQGTTFTDADEIFDTDNFSYDADEVNVSSFPTLNDKIDYLTKRQGVDVSNMSPSTINKAYQQAQSVDNRREAFNREERDPGIINLASPESINLSGDPDEIFEDVSETQYVDPNDVIKQENINTGFSDIPLVDPSGVYTNGTPMYAEDQTGIFNAGSFPKMSIFGNEVGGPRHYLLNQINKYGNADSASEKESFDILNSLGQADGGYMSNFPNQNMGTQSLTASDNIDDRIMKNLQFEKMAPGMMGYNQGGKVMSTFEKLKAINYPS